MASLYPQNARMAKKTSSQVLAENLDRLMARFPGMESNHALGKKAKIAHSHIRRIRLGESAATVDMLDRLAEAFGIQPWELLTDSDEVRQAVMLRLAWGDAASDAKVAEHLPPAPKKKEVATRHRKKADGGENPQH